MIPHDLDTTLRRLQRRALLVGCAALACCLAAAAAAPGQFFRSYLVGFAYCAGFPLGALAVLMVHHLVGGAWGHLTRRFLEASTRTLPALTLLFMPVAIGTRWLYPWTDAAAVGSDALLRHKALWLNFPFFIGRAAFYFAVWWTLAWVLNRWSARQDRTGDPALLDRFASLSAAGLVVFALTGSFAAFDWLMSTEPKWFSTIYGAMVAMGWMLAALAFTVVFAHYLSDREPVRSAADEQSFNDLGNLMLAFLMLWTYMALSQFLLIWSANLPEEIEWYLLRFSGSWLAVAISLPVFHYLVPFLALLSRPLKRCAPALVKVAGLLLVMRLVDNYWLIAPVYAHGGVHAHWMDALCPIGICGLWLAAFCWQLRQMPLIPLHDQEPETAQHEVPAHG